MGACNLIFELPLFGIISGFRNRIAGGTHVLTDAFDCIARRYHQRARYDRQTEKLTHERSPIWA